MKMEKQIKIKMQKESAISSGNTRHTFWIGRRACVAIGMKFLDLPVDVLVVVFEMVDARSLARVASTCASLFFAPTSALVSALCNRSASCGRGCCTDVLPAYASSRAVHLAWTEFRYDEALRRVGGGLMCLFVVDGGRLLSCGRESRFSAGLLGRAHGGDSREASRLAEVPLLTGVCVNSVSSEFGIGCAVSASGSLYTWGTRHLGREIGGGVEPRVVDALHGFRIVCASTGGNHCLAVALSGEVFAWGVAMHGLCGNAGDLPYQPVPTRICSLSRKRVRSASAGNLHSLVVTEDGEIYSFGRGVEGQLGHRGTHDEHVPRQVKSLRHVCICSAAAGGTTSLALSSDGIVFGWGSNSGNEDVAFSCSVPSRFEELSDVRVRFIVAHGDARCAVSCAGEVFTWGRLPAGLLGHGMSVCEQASPRRVDALRCEWVEEVSFGSMHTVAAIRGGGVVGWGDADMLGLGCVGAESVGAGAPMCVPYRHIVP